MKYTQKWTWQNQEKVTSGTYEAHYSGNYRRKTTYIRSTPWMQNYRDKIRAIDTQEKAAKAIQDYWAEVAKEWDNGAGIIKLDF